MQHFESNFTSRRSDASDVTGSFIDLPEIPESLKEQMSVVETLNGFSERFVAVESITFVVDQLRQIRGIVDQLVSCDEQSKTETYFTQVS